MNNQAKRACVIGAGLGGLALAIRLQSAGIATTLCEARNEPGGHAHSWRRDGFIFDAGPAIITEPASFEELWAISDHELASDVELMPIAPALRLNWPDGASLDFISDEQAQLNEITQFTRAAPEDLAGYRDFMRTSSRVQKELHPFISSTPPLTPASMMRLMPALIRHQAWRSAYAIASKHIRNPKLRQALSFQTLLSGVNPIGAATALQAFSYARDQSNGAWWVRGGIGRLTAGMARLFERLGGTLRLGDPVVKVHTLGTQASEVETRGGWKERFDAVASNADIIHSYRDLLGDTDHGRKQARTLARKRFSPGLFVVHFGLEGSWPGIPHRMILFGPRYTGLLKDIFDHGVLPRDALIQLHHPSVTDPSMAPEGKSAFQAIIPVAHMGRLAIDWEQIGPMLEKRILDEIGRRLIPDIHDRIVTHSHYSPRDLALDFNAHLGSAFSLEAGLMQSGWLRTHNRDDVIRNFYLVGAGTHPGAGMAGAVNSAKITAELMLRNLAQ